MRLYLIFSLLILLCRQASAQDFEACYPDEIEPEEPISAEDEEITLDEESVNNYLDLCSSTTTNDEPTERSLLRKTSEVCTEFPIDSGESCIEAGGSERYGYDSKQQTCRIFKYLGCGGNANNFNSMQECSLACEDPCYQPADVGTSTEIYAGVDGRGEKISCFKDSALYFYYDQTTGSCNTLKYLGCGGNKNRFESNEECLLMCQEQNRTAILASPAEYITAVPMTTQQQHHCDEVDDTNAAGFCVEFQKKFPEVANIISSLDRTASSDIDQELVRELESRISAAPSNTSASVARLAQARGLLGLLLGPLKHITIRIYKNNDCRRVDVTVRVWCMKGLTRRPTDSQKIKLCNLVKEGIKKHWETPILHPDGSVNYPVRVTVKEKLLLSKKVILKWYKEDTGNQASYNPGWSWFPMVCKYKGFETNLTFEDIDFKYVGAHELGHGPLTASKTIFWSWRHEGTSTMGGNRIPSSPAIPASPAILNLMWYYNDNLNEEQLDRTFASQSQLYALINQATWRRIKWRCPGAIGSSCVKDKDCNPPGICSWFRCVACNQDSQCPAGEYCKGKVRPLYVNHCDPKKPIGGLCSRDAICESGICDGGRCGECDTDQDCETGSYCNFNNFPLVVNKCVPKKEIGQFCLKDRACLSGYCDGGQCVECEKDNQCPTGQWCKNKHLPLILNRCKPKLDVGGWCTNNNQCILGYCDGGRCGECEKDQHCPSTQYCRWKNLVGVVNKCTDKKCKGLCTRNAQCKSGKCRFFGFCKKC